MATIIIVSYDYSYKCRKYWQNRLAANNEIINDAKVYTTLTILNNTIVTNASLVGLFDFHGRP